MLPLVVILLVLWMLGMLSWVAVLAIGYVTIGGGIDDDTGGTALVAAKGSDDRAGSSFKLDVEKDGGVSGSRSSRNRRNSSTS